MRRRRGTLRLAASGAPRGAACAVGEVHMKTRSGCRGETRRGLELKYRDVEYTVGQGFGRQLWKWGGALEGKALTGQAGAKLRRWQMPPARVTRAWAPINRKPHDFDPQ